MFRLQLPSLCLVPQRDTYTLAEPRLGLGGGQRLKGREARGPSLRSIVLTRVTAALGGFRHEGQMKAGALHCRVGGQKSALGQQREWT